MDVYAWLIVFIVCVVLEAATAGLATIWFAGGALVAFLLALLKVGLVWQFIAFIAVSILLLAFTRPLVQKYVNRRTEQTNVVDKIIGKSGMVIEEINNILGSGRIMVDGMPWTARSEEQDMVIPEGVEVTVVSLAGVKCIVRQ